MDRKMRVYGVEGKKNDHPCFSKEREDVDGVDSKTFLHP